MWITKVIFKGTDGNATTTFDESTDEHYARFKYSREICKWLKILCNMEFPIASCPHTNAIEKNRDDISLDIIQLFINAINKENNYTNISFEISMYEKIKLD